MLIKALKILAIITISLFLLTGVVLLSRNISNIAFILDSHSRERMEIKNMKLTSYGFDIIINDTNITYTKDYNADEIFEDVIVNKMKKDLEDFYIKSLEMQSRKLIPKDVQLYDNFEYYVDHEYYGTNKITKLKIVQKSVSKRK